MLQNVWVMQKGKVYVCGQGDSGQLGLGNLIPDDDEDEDLDDPSEIKLPKHSPVDAADSEVGLTIQFTQIP